MIDSSPSGLFQATSPAYGHRSACACAPHRDRGLDDARAQKKAGDFWRNPHDQSLQIIISWRLHPSAGESIHPGRRPNCAKLADSFRTCDFACSTMCESRRARPETPCAGGNGAGDAVGRGRGGHAPIIVPRVPRSKSAPFFLSSLASSKSSSSALRWPSRAWPRLASSAR
jgi:hypothetical protein